MVGASLKSRSGNENCWFSLRTTPRSRGEDFNTQNGKNNIRAKKRFGTAESIAESGRGGKTYFVVVEAQIGRSAPVRAPNKRLPFPARLRYKVFP